MSNQEISRDLGIDSEPQPTNGIQIYELGTMSSEDRDRIMQRSKVDISEARAAVLPVIDDVRERGDIAVLDHIEEFGGPRLTPEDLRISDDEVSEAYKKINPELLLAIKEQVEISRTFHEAQYNHINRDWEVETVPGVIVRQRTTPIDSVVLHVPGDSAQFPSVALTLAVAASVAGVKRIALTTPPRDDMDAIIVAAKEAGATEIYKAGGVAAIAAFTYGTETIERVVKIVGPGGKFVSAAMSLVSDDIDTGMKAGPSEVLIIADEEANPAYCAADMLSASEHGPDSASVLVTWDRGVADRVQEEITNQVIELDRREDAEESLGKYSAIILVENKAEAVAFANEYAPEHMELMTEDAENLVDEITEAGSIIIGPLGSKPVVDFGSGENHIVPTGRGSRTLSPIGVDSFTKRTEILTVTAEGLRFLAPMMRTIADFEGFGGHRESIDIRMRDLEQE